MSVKFTETALPGVLIVESTIFRDGRGSFQEAHNQRAWAEQGFEQHFVQDNLSVSARGALRGMHYQIEPHGMGKLVRAVQGSLFDVAIDLRRGSPTFGKWTGLTLSQENGLALWVPVGFAHGFLALEEGTVAYYKCTGTYTPDAERALLFNDPAIGVEWPAAPTLLSDKDAAAPPLADAEHNFVFERQ